MPSNKPRVTLRLDDDEFKYLEQWAAKEFLTVPQLTRVIVKKAIAREKEESSKSEWFLWPKQQDSATDNQPQPALTKPEPRDNQKLLRSLFKSTTFIK